MSLSESSGTLWGDPWGLQERSSKGPSRAFRMVSLEVARAREPSLRRCPILVQDSSYNQACFLGSRFFEMLIGNKHRLSSHVESLRGSLFQEIPASERTKRMTLTASFLSNLSPHTPLLPLHLSHAPLPLARIIHQKGFKKDRTSAKVLYLLSKKAL
jgi:hypothetical protein